MSQPGFWDNPEKAQSVASQLGTVKSVIDPVEELQREVRDLADLCEMAIEEGDDEERDVGVQPGRCRKAERSSQAEKRLC